MNNSYSKKNLKEMIEKLKENGYEIHFQKHPQYDEFNDRACYIEFKGQKIYVPFTNMAGLYYLLHKHKGKYEYSQRVNKREYQDRIMFWYKTMINEKR